MTVTDILVKLINEAVVKEETLTNAQVYRMADRYSKLIRNFLTVTHQTKQGNRW